ncbi:aaa-atpase vps4-associated 1 domain-containing [Trichoderma arundinaceum]|uniref:Aaa-atpase vps4-associated 1 domain-containing n=1 Tax=Trichoderma arundinaceum TaxID=490622 RepID=A0A395P004_TRIAR|nr:aaa-atpase vps4-associated 1 domain-containing [Trichoderma arundinaceum]
MAAPFPNIYTHRKVADSAAKACDICYKPSSSVLITPDKKDFFYICPVHLKDRYFCTPKVDEDAVKAKREKELAEEKDKLMKEYEEKQRKKKEKEKEKEKEKDKEKDKDKDKDGGKDKDKDKEKKDSKDEDEEKKDDGDETPKEEDEPRVFELKSSFYQQRLQRKRQAEAAKRDRERASQPNYFPSVPTEPPKK